MTNARILVVDDEPQIRRVMRTSLTEQGYIVTDGRSGEEALERLRNDHPDLVLLDMNMPDRLFQIMNVCFWNGIWNSVDLVFCRRWTLKIP